jgi:hypothetical protein
MTMKRPGIRIVREPYTPPPAPPESLRYTLDVYDERDNHVETIGRLADLSVAHAALRAAVDKHPGKRIFLRERARVIKRYDELG